MLAKKIAMMVLSAALGTGSFMFSSESLAKRTAEEKAAKVAAKEAKKAAKEQLKAEKKASKGTKSESENENEVENENENESKSKSDDSIVASASKATTEERATRDAARAAERAAKEAAKSSSKSRVELMAKFRLDETGGQEVEEGRELYVRYRSRSGEVRLQAQAQNFAVGTIFNVYLNDVLLGSVTVQETAEGIQGELSFRDSNWPAGVPTTLEAGVVVTFTDSSNAIVAQGPMTAK